MSRSVLLYLRDIRDHCAEISEHVHGLSYEDFFADRRTYKAVVYSLLVIGEAAKHVPEDVRARHPEVPWRRIAGMRDVIAHGYFALDDRVVWDVVQHEVPALRIQVEAILASAPERPE